MPDISIIVPVYKVEEYLPRCIESILAQTYIDFELLLIDDGSPDNCGIICDEYAKKDKRIRVFHKENGGVSSARNFGLDHITGEYVSFIDSDDIIHPQFLETLRFYASENVVPYCDYQVFKDNVLFMPQKVCEMPVELIDPMSFTQYNNAFSVVWNKLFHKSILLSHYFETSHKNGEDTLFAYDCISESRPNLVHIEEPLYGYFLRGTGAVATIDYQGKRDLFLVLDSIYLREKKETINCSNIRNQWVGRTTLFFYDSKKNNAEDHILAKKSIMKELPFILSKKCSVLSGKEKMFLLFSVLFNR